MVDGVATLLMPLDTNGVESLGAQSTLLGDSFLQVLQEGQEPVLSASFVDVPSEFISSNLDVFLSTPQSYFASQEEIKVIDQNSLVDAFVSDQLSFVNRVVTGVLSSGLELPQEVLLSEKASSEAEMHEPSFVLLQTPILNSEPVVIKEENFLDAKSVNVILAPQDSHKQSDILLPVSEGNNVSPVVLVDKKSVDFQGIKPQIDFLLQEAQEDHLTQQNPLLNSLKQEVEKQSSFEITNNNNAHLELKKIVQENKKDIVLAHDVVVEKKSPNPYEGSLEKTFMKDKSVRNSDVLTSENVIIDKGVKIEQKIFDKETTPKNADINLNLNLEKAIFSSSNLSKDVNIVQSNIVQNSGDIFAQVTRGFNSKIQDDQGRFTIQLQPESLGKIDVVMNVNSEGGVSASLYSDNPQTLEVLQSNIKELISNLTDSGYQVDEKSFHFSSFQENQKNNQHEFAKSFLNKKEDMSIFSQELLELAPLVRSDLTLLNIAV